MLVYPEEQSAATADERSPMAGIVEPVQQHESPGERQTKIVDVLVEAFSELMGADPDAFRQKFRKMAADPFAFYRGSAPLFYADMEREEDPWADERTSRVWIQGDLHAENFGTYMEQVRYFVESDRDHEYALRLETTDGQIREILLETRLNTRIDLLDRLTLIDENFERRFRRSAG